MHRIAIVLAVVALVAPAHARSPCARPLIPIAVGSSQITAPINGGLVVGAVRETRGRDSADVVVPAPGWRFRDGERTAEPTIELVAPGLAIYHLPPNWLVGDLENDQRRVVGRISAGPDVAQHAAPVIDAVYVQGTGGGTRSAVLLADVPDDVFALVLVDAEGKPRAWAVASGNRELVLFSDDTPCDHGPGGTSGARVGERVTLFWIDSTGRRSKSTRPIRVVDAQRVFSQP